MSAPRAIRTRTHHVVGERDAVRTALECAYADGRLVGLRSPALLPDGRVRVTAELLEPAPAVHSRRTMSLRPWLIDLGVLAGIAAAGAAVWLIVLGVLALIALITTAVAWVSAHLVLILVGLGLLLLCCGGGRCAGVHCGGCRR